MSAGWTGGAGVRGMRGREAGREGVGSGERGGGGRGERGRGGRDRGGGIIINYFIDNSLR